MGHTPSSRAQDPEVLRGAMALPVAGVLRAQDGSRLVRPETPSAHKGTWSMQFLDDEHKSNFVAIRARLAADYSYEAGADEIGLDLVSIFLCKLGHFLKRPMDTPKSEAAFLAAVPAIATLDGLVRNHFKELKATRASKGGKGAKSGNDGKETGEGGEGGLSMAEWASKILEVKESDQGGDRGTPASVGGQMAPEDDEPEGDLSGESAARPLSQGEINAIRERVRSEALAKNAVKVSHNTLATKRKGKEKPVLF